MCFVQIQQLLALCGEHIEAEEGAAWKAVHQSAAVIGLGLIAQSEELGAQMAHRALEHLLQYGEPPVRLVCHQCTCKGPSSKHTAARGDARRMCACHKPPSFG